MKNYLERKTEVTEIQCVINDRFIYYREQMVKYYSLCHAPVADIDSMRRAKNHIDLTKIALELEVSLNRQIDHLKSVLQQLDFAISDVQNLLKTLDYDN